MRYQRKNGGRCQFKGVLYEAAAVIIAIGGGRVNDWIEKQVADRGMEEKENAESWYGMRTWLAF